MVNETASGWTSILNQRWFIKIETFKRSDADTNLRIAAGSACGDYIGLQQNSRWSTRFRQGQESTEDKERCGRPSTILKTQLSTAADSYSNWNTIIKQSPCINLLKPTGHVMHQQFNISTTVRSAHTVFVCFVFIWEQTATCATYVVNWLVFITEMKSVYCAVRTGSSNKAVCHSSLKG